MFEFAETNLTMNNQDSLTIDLRILENFTVIEEIAENLGYIQDSQRAETTTVFQLDEIISKPELPSGYTFSSMDISNNLEKRSRVFAKAFGNYGTPDEVKSNIYLELQKSPDYKPQLDVYVVSPNDDFVSFCLIWYDTKNKIGILEPVGTDPEHRRKGLGKAAVFEAIRRVQKLGATKIYVGDGQQFYRSLGFETAYKNIIWTKRF
ncbi:GNAT family N-acetyltransferase [Candidatus Heimdallarchaeota archaeon]|nr:MAG: GNAT family N-acetyltransferase [Candidatus Heimdallarchaeota archaeon]